MSDDRILMRGLVFYGYHGVTKEENRLGQRFIVDVDMIVSLGDAGRSDDLTKTVDYGAVLADVRAIAEGPPLKLIEAVAERIAAKILGAYAVDAVRVRVRKPDVPLPAILEYVGVEITRRRAS
jgi:7,8-dihydroneopterin aldolase/epimerase/oxygenase